MIANSLRPAETAGPVNEGPVNAGPVNDHS